MEETWTKAPAARSLDGSETFAGLDATVQDFWRFALSDLRMNNARGYLAEFLVARAVGSTTARVEWDAFDVLAPSGARIEVKSSAYLQAWDQRQLSRIVFSGLTGRTWSYSEGRQPTATYNADVYVFCAQMATQHEQYDPLDLDQWQFYVLPRFRVARLACNSIGLRRLTAATGSPLRHTQLASAIDIAYTQELEKQPTQGQP